MTFNDLWEQGTERDWNRLLKTYWDLVRDENVLLEYHMNRLTPADIEGLDAEGWYDFLHDEYFVWKYTSKNRLATTRMSLRKYSDEDCLDELLGIRDEILAIDRYDIAGALKTVTQIKGLGTAGGSGLLSLLYPEDFATVDQFVVKALLDTDEWRDQVKEMNPDGLRIADGVFLTEAMREKADDLNERFATMGWTPRTVEMALWAYRSDVCGK